MSLVVIAKGRICGVGQGQRRVPQVYLLWQAWPLVDHYYQKPGCPSVGPGSSIAIVAPYTSSKFESPPNVMLIVPQDITISCTEA